MNIHSQISLFVKSLKENWLFHQVSPDAYNRMTRPKAITWTKEKTLKYSKKIISQFAEEPEILNTCLTIINCEYLQYLFTQNPVDIVQAYEIYTILDVLASRKDFYIKYLCNQFDSNLLESIKACKDIEELSAWFRFICDFSSNFNVECLISLMSLHNKLSEFILAQLNTLILNESQQDNPDKGKQDLIKMLVALSLFQKKKKHDIRNLLNLVVDFGIAYIRKSEELESFWDISDILQVLAELDIDCHKDVIQCFISKYGCSKRKEIFSKFIEEKELEKVNSYFEFCRKFTIKNYEIDSGEVNIEIFSGNLNRINSSPITGIRLKAIDPNVIEEEIKLFSSFYDIPHIPKFYGTIRSEENSYQVLYSVFESFPAEHSLFNIKINKLEFDIFEICKDLYSVLSDLISKNILVYYISPKTVFYVNGHIKISNLSLCKFIPYSDFLGSFIPQELAEYFQGKTEILQVLKCISYSFGCTLAFMLEPCYEPNGKNKEDPSRFFSDSYIDKLVLKQQDKLKLKKILSASLSSDPLNRISFQDLGKFIN